MSNPKPRTPQGVHEPTQHLDLNAALVQSLDRGHKRVTVRKGRRNIQLGMLAYRPTDRSMLERWVQVNEVRYKRLRDLTEQEATLDDGHTPVSLGFELARYYPDLRLDDEVTVVIHGRPITVTGT